MSEWQTFTGAPEQFLALSEARHGVIIKGMSEPVPMTDLQELTAYFRNHGTFEFLICNPQPLADMICQQARTGQPVYVKTPSRRIKNAFDIYKTTKPNWHWTDSEFSFTPFEE